MSDKDPKKPRDRDEKPRERRPPPERAGHVAPTDPRLVEFLEHLWTRDMAPTRLEVWLVGGTHRNVRLNLVFHENFRQPETPAENWHVEHCARLAGEILRACQDWADSKRRTLDFEIAITDPYQETAPLTKPLGPFAPKQAYSGVYPDGEPRSLEDDDEDGAIGIKPLSHKYVNKIFRSMHRTMEQVHAMMGDFMQIQQGGLLSAYGHNERLQNHNMALYEQKQTADDRALDREVFREKEKMKIKAIGTGLNMSQTVLAGWFGVSGDDGGERKALGAGTGTSHGHGASKERALIVRFLSECKEKEIGVDLFGDWEEKEEMTVPEVSAGLGLRKKGVFTPAQFGLLLGVASGQLPASALDALMEGGAQAITKEQFDLAAPFLTQSMWLALGQIKDLRDESREQVQTVETKQEAK